MALENKEMRETYAETLIKLAEEDERIVLVEADLMRAVRTTLFQERFPERVIDVGVAEANMIGVAAGLAAFGKIPFTHSFCTFAARRCFDQVFISVAYAGLNVKMMGSDPGVTAELNGGTHMCFEDLGVMRNVPGLVIFEPVDGVQLRKVLPQIVNHPGPVYIRMSRKQVEQIYEEDCRIELGKACTLREGSDAVIFASGIMVENALTAARSLQDEGLSIRVVNIHTIKPLDQEAVIKAARETGAVVTAENHSIFNGLGSAVAEVLGEKAPVPLRRVGVKDRFGEVGPVDFLLNKFQLTAEDIVESVRDVIDRK